MSKKICLLGVIALSNLQIQPGFIEDDFIVDIGMNKALAKEFEIITVSRDRYRPPLYKVTIGGGSGRGHSSDVSENRARDERARNSDREGFCRLQPLGCNADNAPSLAPNGCSTEIGSVDFFNNWDNVLVGACNQHDACYSTLGSSFDTCNRDMRTDMVNICSERNREAAENGGFFNVSACWDKSTEYYLGVVAFGGSFFENAQKDAACVDWLDLGGSGC